MRSNLPTHSVRGRLMPLPDAAGNYWLGQQRITLATLALVKRLWLRLDVGNFDESWDRMSPTLVGVVEQAQSATIRGTQDYIPTVLGELNIDIDPIAALEPAALVGVTGAGIQIEEAAYNSIIKAKSAVIEGTSPQAALELGGQWLQMLVQTALADTSRAAEAIAVVTRPGLGYVRMLNPPSCSRCVILAGRFYRWNAGFKRHPRCDCKSIPAPESIAGDLTVNPERYFQQLTSDEQNRTFGVSNAQAIRDGADINQVVNAGRGLQQAQVYGRQLEYTTEGTTKRGVAGRIIRARGRSPKTTPRLMPSAIYDIAEDRGDALRLLNINGYLLDRDGVPLSGRGSRSGITAAPEPRVSKFDTRVAASPASNVQTAGISVAPDGPPVAGYAESVSAQIDERIPFLARMQFENDFLAVPLHVRQLLNERGVQVIASRRVSEGPYASMFDGITSADGRAIDDISFYQNQIKAVVISTDAPHGSVNVVAHEIGHALDSQALRDNPVDVVWQEQGNPNLPASIRGSVQQPRTEKVDRFINDPYIRWAHDEHVLNSPSTDPYWRTGSEGTPKSGREEWIAEGYAALIAGNDAQLLAISGGSRQAADILTWTYRRMGVLP